MSHNPPRRHKRYPVSWKVEITASSWDDALQLTTDNVSRGGLFIACDDPPEVGSELEIELELPDDSFLRMTGVIVHSINAARAAEQGLAPGFGVRFNEKHAIDLNLLEGIASVNAGGRNNFLLDESYITLPATLFGQGGLKRIPTSAYHLVIGNGDEEDTAEEEELEVEVEEPQSRPATRNRQPSASIPPSEIIFGVDFGTSYSSIALAYSDHVAVMPDKEGKPMTPSVVSYPEKGPPLVGWAAREQMATLIHI